jgi:hypothetical protein
MGWNSKFQVSQCCLLCRRCSLAYSACRLDLHLQASLMLACHLFVGLVLLSLLPSSMQPRRPYLPLHLGLVT